MDFLKPRWGPEVIAIVVALGIGLLIGLERERRKGEGPGRSPAGLRTFAAASLAGAVSVMIGGKGLLALVSAGIVVLPAIAYLRSRNDFGGGHVVLPLLREAFVAPGWLSDDAFLAGYVAAQAVPGPLFTFAAYLGTVVSPERHGLSGAALGLVGIFLPGILVLLGALPFWDSFRKPAGAQAMMRGVNAAVVGVLGAALYDPVWTTTVHSPRDFGIALVGFVLLIVWRAPPLVVVAFSAAAGTAVALI
ncbi:putative chromate ion transporter [Bradyrhizobium japonicum]